MTTGEAADTLPPARRRGLRNVIGASLIGTSLECLPFLLSAALLITITAVLVARETATMELTAEQAPEEVAAVEPPAARPRPVFH